MANCVLLVLGIVVGVHSHGRLLNPASRSSLWRLPQFASLNPNVNMQDNATFCGYVSQVDDPGTSCGVCGDPISDSKPRANEIGGTYDQGIITGVYRSGQIIETVVQITYFHGGTWEWRLCTNPQQETQACFNRHVLQLADGRGTKYPARRVGTHTVRLKLPNNVTCKRCILQWHHRAGDAPGDCGNGRIARGCGPQTNYRGCADITIV